MTAEEYFEWVRSCARDVRAARERMASAHEGGGSSPMVAARFTIVDPMARVDAALDREAELAAYATRCERVVEGARRVTHEVGMALGLNPKLALELYYIELNTWDDIALELHLSIATVYRMRRQAFEWVDVTGLVVGAGRQS